MSSKHMKLQIFIPANLYSLFKEIARGGTWEILVCKGGSYGIFHVSLVCVCAVPPLSAMQWQSENKN